MKSMPSIYLHVLKPALDYSLAIFSLIMFLPFLLVLVFILLFSQRSPVFYTQIRPGYKGRLFKLYKFRTMSDASDQNGNLLPDDQRITRVGHFLRKSSLDELPQLINILKGDISLVGPRPLLPEYMERYTDEQKRRHLVKPGLTGWAQINGRNSISWEEKFKLDIYYVDHISFKLDIIIILRSVIQVLKGSLVYNQNGTVMRKFEGANE